MQTTLADIVDKEVTRREFFSLVGYGLAAVIGLTSLLQFLGKSSTQQPRTGSAGYGSSAYGR
jgi:hypothetical protein